MSARRPARFPSPRLWSAVLGAVLLAATLPVAAQNVAGRFLTVIGEVRVLSPSGDRRPERGEEVREGETLLTGAGALTQIRLADGGMLSIRGDTEMKFDRFSHTGENDRDSSMFISLLKGGFRSVTGLIGRLNRDGYRITTPSATIGIRGTDHEPVVVPPPPPGATPEVPPGTYDRVNAGETFIRNAQGVIQNIGPNQVGFISIQGAAPVILPQLPPIYRSAITPGPAPSAGPPGGPPGGAHKSAPARAGEPGAAPGAGTGVRSAPELQRLPAVQGAPNLQTAPELQRLPAVQGAPNLQTAPELQRLPAVQGAPNLPTAPTLPTAPMQTSPALQTAPIQTAPSPQTAPAIQTAPALQTAPIQTAPIR